jgi:hypothetical protein
LTEAARLRWSSVDPAGVERLERADFAEFVSLALAGAAANAGGIEEILAGRSGSWEAGYVRDMLASTVGWEEEYLWEHRTEPLALRVQVDAILTELGIADLYEDSEAEITRLEDAVGVCYDVLGPDGLWACSDPDAAPLTAEEIAAVRPWALPGHRVYRQPTSAQQAQLDRLNGLQDGLDSLREREWAAYGQAFRAAVLAELDREPVKGLRVPVEVYVDARICPRGADPLEDSVSAPVVRLWEAGWLNTPLPGSGIAPRDYPLGADIAQVERGAGRLPHLRVGDA